MGLDMYLQASYNISGSDLGRTSGDEVLEKQANIYDTIIKTLDVDLNGISKYTRSLTVTVDVAYWRKFNALHNWFITNCAQGKDNCHIPVWVLKGDLRRLVSALRMIVDTYERETNLRSDEIPESLYSPLPPATLEVAKTHLPTLDGFSFGPTDYSLYYLSKVASALRELEQIIEKFAGNPDIDFYYLASW